MTWINLSDVFLPKAGGVIDGDLVVSGDLTVGGNYNSEMQTYQDNGVNAKLYMGCVYIVFSKSASGIFEHEWSETTITTLPEGMRPPVLWISPLMVQGSDYAQSAVFYVYADGKVSVVHKGGAEATSAGWVFASMAYPAAP